MCPSSIVSAPKARSCVMQPTRRLEGIPTPLLPWSPSSRIVPISCVTGISIPCSTLTALPGIIRISASLSSSLALRAGISPRSAAFAVPASISAIICSLVRKMRLPSPILKAYSVAIFLILLSCYL